jgi:hypothetical protein
MTTLASVWAWTGDADAETKPRSGSKLRKLIYSFQRLLASIPLTLLILSSDWILEKVSESKGIAESLAVRIE